jgi:hypothetical protein
MNRRRTIAAVVVLGSLWLALAGCGEKIAIPEARGLFSVAPYYGDGELVVNDPRQVLAVQGNLFVLAADSLTKRDQAFNLIAAATGFGDAQAMCSDDGDSLVFVWDQDRRQVDWLSARTLEPPVGLPSTTPLPDVQRCVAMATSRAGVEQVPGAVTFLYLADPDSGVVHRYAYEPFTGLIPHGILCRGDGDGTRFVHVPGGMVRDHEDSLLVCDLDTLRNWVIRFHSVPDVTDTATTGPNPLRGWAALFGAATCDPPAAADYVLGDAAECNEGDWQGGPGSAEGEFHLPSDVTVDGSGRIYVADTRNDRIQLFDDTGFYQVYYGTAETTPAPVSVAVVDVRTGGGADEINHGAYMYLVSGGLVRKYISGEHYNFLNAGLPPPEQ